MKPNSLRAKNAINALYAMLFGSAMMILIGIYTAYLVSDMSLMFTTEAEYNSYLILIGIVSFVFLVIYIICVVMFIMWFRRAYFNLHKLVPSSQLKYSEGWAAGAWFIPIFNLWGPYQIATDLFSKSEALLVKHNLMEGKPNFHLIKNWWWGLWIAAGILNRISSRMDDDIDLLLTGSIIGVIGSILAIGAGLLAIQTIKNYSKMEELLKQIPQTDGATPTMQITNDDLLDSGI
ncbi:MAG: DUF4328 domain-containing protein [Crocinitomicaceae bacterium]|nr:DUF4328 domain-containing protein [Flavobacteriales bacterium]NQZ36143.1 DUF4328 domain-containing protein [Crocinitomicaceae bacterium]